MANLSQPQPDMSLIRERCNSLREPDSFTCFYVIVNPRFCSKLFDQRILFAQKNLLLESLVQRTVQHCTVMHLTLFQCSSLYCTDLH